MTQMPLLGLFAFLFFSSCCTTLFLHNPHAVLLLIPLVVCVLGDEQAWELFDY
jgi:hypothetical protein